MMRRVIVAALVLAGGCATASYAAQGAEEVTVAPAQPGYPQVDAVYAMASTDSRGRESGSGTEYDVGLPRDANVREQSMGAPLRTPELERPPPQYAQATPTSGSTAPVADVRPTPSAMLVYTAAIVVAVLDVTLQQTQLIERARTMGGFLAEQSSTTLRLRVPAPRFEELLAAIAEVGQVIDRRITVSDVGQEFRDVAIRIQNLEAVRHRFEQMLAQATNVETALAIQRELERVTTELELLKGRQRYLADQVALSTITIHFQPLASVYPDAQVRLPFPWLSQLGLRNLMTLDRQ